MVRMCATINVQLQSINDRLENFEKALLNKREPAEEGNEIKQMFPFDN